MQAISKDGKDLHAALAQHEVFIKMVGHLRATYAMNEKDSGEDFIAFVDPENGHPIVTVRKDLGSVFVDIIGDSLRNHVNAVMFPSLPEVLPQLLDVLHKQCVDEGINEHEAADVVMERYAKHIRKAFNAQLDIGLGHAIFAQVVELSMIRYTFDITEAEPLVRRKVHEAMRATCLRPLRAI